MGPMCCSCKILLMALVLPLTPSWQLFSHTDRVKIMKEISANLTDGVWQFTNDLLLTSQLETVFRSQSKSELFTDDDMKSVLASLGRGVKDTFLLCQQAVKEVQSKLLTYFASPGKPRLGPPRLVPKCCKAYGPNELIYHEKLRMSVDSQHVCYSRDRTSGGQGFDLWADDALDAIKTNFESIPSILWQEIGTRNGLHVQFPTRSRSCDGNGNSDSPILRPWYREKLNRHSVNLVIVLDASDEMLNRVRGKVPPITHWDIVKKAAIDVFRTLMPRDKVTIVTTGNTILMPSLCNTSLLINTESNMATLKTFVESISPKGSPQYPEVFKQAFNFLLQEEVNAKKSGQGAHNVTNVLLLLTNAETPLVLRVKDLFQAVVRGQEQLDSKCHIQVYAIRQLGTQAAFNTFLRLADQNNEKLTADNGIGIETAGSWAPEGFTQTVGPAGFMTSVLDSEGFRFSDRVVEFERQLPISMTPLKLLLLSPVELKSREGPSLQILAPLVSDANTSYGVYAVTLSVEKLLNKVTGFHHQFSTYAFVVEKGTGQVLSHPKLEFQAEVTSTPSTLPDLGVLEPDLTSEQTGRIMSSNCVQRYFDAKISTGREVNTSPTFNSSLPKDARIGHLLVEQTNFIVVLVIFKSEMERRHLLLHPPPSPSKAIYHRFDQLPTNAPRCVTSGTIAMEQIFGVSLSPDLFTDSSNYKFKGLTTTDLLELNSVIRDPARLTTDLKLVGRLSSLLNLGVNESQELALDMVVFTSSRLKEIWENTQITAIHRFIGTARGVLTTWPAIAFPNTMDYRKYQWYTEAVIATDDVIFTQSKFPGAAENLIISQAFGGSWGVVGVTGASVSSVVLKSLLLNQVPECAAVEYSCELIDKRGYFLDLWNMQTGRNHVTKRYPWLASYLLRNSFLKTIWCSDLIIRHNRASFMIATTHNGIDGAFLNNSNTDDCRKFMMHPIHKTNLFVLVLASRSASKCQPEINSPKESCGLSSPQPLSPGQLFPLCDSCRVDMDGVTTQKCQPPCYCQLEIDSCSGEYKKLNPSWTFEVCQETTLDPPADANKPDAPGPTVSQCPRKCSQLISEQDCQQHNDCEWDDTKPFPTCKRKVMTTAASRTTTTTTLTSKTLAVTTETKSPEITVSKLGPQVTSAKQNGISVKPITDDVTSTLRPVSGVTSSQSSYSDAIIVGVSVPVILLLCVACFLIKKSKFSGWMLSKQE